MAVFPSSWRLLDMHGRQSPTPTCMIYREMWMVSQCTFKFNVIQQLMSQGLWYAFLIARFIIAEHCDKVGNITFHSLLSVFHYLGSHRTCMIKEKYWGRKVFGALVFYGGWGMGWGVVGVWGGECGRRSNMSSIPLVVTILFKYPAFAVLQQSIALDPNKRLEVCLYACRNLAGITSTAMDEHRWFHIVLSDVYGFFRGLVNRYFKV